MAERLYDDITVTPAGGLVNTFQGDPDVAGLGDGTFLVAWTGPTFVDDDGVDDPANELFGRIFDGAFPATTAFQINTETLDVQYQPTAERLDNGNFIVGYRSGSAIESGLGDHYAVQEIAADGTKIGPERFVDAQEDVPITTAFNGDGSFAVAYSGKAGSPGALTYSALAQPVASIPIGDYSAGFPPEGESGAGSAGQGRYVFSSIAQSTRADAEPFTYDVTGEIRTEDGLLIGDRFLIDADVGFNSGAGINPAFALLGNGDVVIAFTARSAAGTDADIFAMIVDPDDGAIVRSRFVLAGGADNQSGPVLTGIDDGGFVVGWNTSSQNSFLLEGQVFDADGTARDSRFAISSDPGGSGPVSDVASIGNDDFVFVWSEAGGIEAAVFSADPVPSGSDATLVNTTNFGDQSDSAVARLANGNYVVVWVDASQFDSNVRTEIRGQIVAANGSRIGSEFKVNTDSPDVDHHPRVSASADGGFAVTWIHGSDEFYPESDAFLQRFAANGSRIGPEIATGNSFATLSATAALPSGYTAVISQDLDFDRLQGTVYRPDGAAINTFQLDTRFDTTAFEATALAGGSFVVAYVARAEDEEGAGIPQLHVAQYTTRGAFLRDTVIADVGSPPQIAAFANGSYIVGWTTADAAIVGQIYDSKGVAIGAPLVMADGADLIDLATLSDGRFVASWGAEGSVRTQVFTTQGDRSGAEETLVGFDVALAGAGDGGYVLTYTGVGAEGDGSGTAIRQHLYQGDTLIGGSAAAELLRGSDQGETFYAGRGADRINAGGGNDLIYAENDKDMVRAGIGDDLAYGGFQGDTLYGEQGDDILVGDIATLPTASTGGSDTLDGGQGEDILYGDGYLIGPAGSGGRDTLFGGDDGDILYGDARTLQAGARGGGDALFGGQGNDTLYGDGAVMAAGAIGGSDTLDGGAGDDELWGGGGSDRFVFAATEFGRDRIEDFSQAGPERDRIDLHGLGLTFADLSITSDGLGNLIVASAGFGFNENSITLAGLSAVTSGDFLF